MIDNPKVKWIVGLVLGLIFAALMGLEKFHFGGAAAPRGRQGFGWDSVFVPEGAGDRSFGEMSDDEKNAISHRRRAFDALRKAGAFYLRRMMKSTGVPNGSMSM